jgi:hypothetical protein
MQDESQDDFAKEAERARPGAARELLSFLAQNKKWWIAPVVVVLLVIGALIVLSGTAAAPLIYTLF